MEEMNKMNLSRRGFLKTAALAGAALAMPGGLDNVFAAGTKQQPETSGKILMPHILRAIAYWVPVRQPLRFRPSVSV